MSDGTRCVVLTSQDVCRLLKSSTFHRLLYFITCVTIVLICTSRLLKLSFLLIGFSVEILETFSRFFISATWHTYIHLLDTMALTILLIYLLTYLLYGRTALEELWLPSNEGFFIWFNFSYTYFLLEAEWWVISPSPQGPTRKELRYY